ncbi:hypothetical protein TNCV_4567301 [Trichonephila clavipes]|nr:hypothetical protein TNCV_4567301 [Trichonephila clavipes]
MFLITLQTLGFNFAIKRTVVEVVAIVALRWAWSSTERIPSNGHIAASANIAYVRNVFPNFNKEEGILMYVASAAQLSSLVDLAFPGRQYQWWREGLSRPF